jgi:hypothetical protein
MNFRHVLPARSKCDNAAVRTSNSTEDALVSGKRAGRALSHPTPRSLLTIGFLCITMAASCVFAQPRPVPVPLPTLIANGEQIISFICICSLSPDERQRITQFAQGEVRRIPDTWYRNDVTIRQDLNTIRQNPGAISAERWENWRVAFAQASPSDVERQIIEAHDPTVVFDRENQLVITEHTLQNLYGAAVWATRQAGVASPGPDYVWRMRNIIKQRYTSWPPDVRAWYAHAVRDLAATKEYLPVVSPTLRNNLFVAWRGDNFADPESATLLVKQMSVIYNLDLQERQRLLMEARSGLLHSLVQADPNRQH